MKSTDTLVDDIYKLMESHEADPEVNVEEEIEKFGEAVKDLMRAQFGRDKMEDKRTLRLSNIGRTDRYLWNVVAGTEKEKILPHTYVKFLYGHLIEEMLLFLTRMAGHEVTDEQKHCEVEGIRGSMDCKIDGVVTDVKSASSFGFKKFRDGSLLHDDPFGYVMQGHLYGAATGLDFGGWIVINKSSGEVAIVEAYDWTGDDRIAYMVEAAQRVNFLADPNVKPFKPYPDEYETYKRKGEVLRTGNKVLPKECGLCGFRGHCWPDAILHERVTSQAKSPPKVWYTRLKTKEL